MKLASPKHHLRPAVIIPLCLLACLVALFSFQHRRAAASISGDAVNVQSNNNAAVSVVVGPTVELPNAGPTLGASGNSPRWNIDLDSARIRIDFIDQVSTYGVGSFFLFSGLDPRTNNCNGVLSGITVTTNKPTAQVDVASLSTFTANSVRVQFVTNSANLNWSPGEFIEVALRFQQAPNCNCLPPPDGMTAWWTFDETSGTTAADRTGFNNVGVYKNLPTPGAGYVAGALCFDGVDDYVEVADHPEINAIGDCSNDVAEAMTIDAWVRTTQSSGLAVILDKRSPATVGYHLFLVDGRLGFQMATGAANAINFVAPASGPQFRNVADGNWHLVAVIFTRCRAGAGRLYVDGELVHTFAPLAGEINNTAPLNIGRRDPAHSDIYFNGCIDELEIFKRALDEAEIRALYQAGRTGKCKVDCASKNITLTPATLTNATWAANQSYPLVTFTASGGTAPYTVAVSNGALPPGMMLTNGVLSGAPTTPGTYTFTLTVTDADGCTRQQRYTIFIIACNLSFGPQPLPNATLPVGTLYPALQFTVAGVTAECGPATFSLSSGALPPGMSLSSTGQLTGTPMQTGAYNFVVKLTDKCGCMTLREFQINVTCPTLTIGPATLPDGTQTIGYPQQMLMTTGGFGPYSYMVASGQLPPGLALSDGKLTGTPTQAGTFIFTIKVTDAFGCMTSKSYTLVVRPCANSITVPLQLFNTGVTASGAALLATGQIDSHYILQNSSPVFPNAVAYSATDVNALTWVANSAVSQWIGPVPQMFLNSPAGFYTYRTTVDLTGLDPASAVINGSWATDNEAEIFINGQATGIVTAVNGFTPLQNFTLTNTTVAGGFTAGVNTLDFRVRNRATSVGGDTPTGLRVELSGRARRYCPTITIAPNKLPMGVAGTPYTAPPFTASGGTAPYTFSLASGALPMGMTLQPNGQLTGTPMQTGNFIFVVKVTDANGCMGTRKINVVIKCGSPTINTSALPSGTVSTAYNQTVTATGGCGNFTYAATGLPKGLSLSVAGVLSGTPTDCGTFIITVKATDKCGCMVTRNLTLTIEGVVAPITGLFNTGVNNSSGLLAVGATDFHYTVIPPLSATPELTRVIMPNVAWTTLPGAQWIVPVTAPSNLPGTYRYRTTINLVGCDINTVVITGQYAADNSGFIQVNGAGAFAPTPNPTGFNPATMFTLTAASGLIAGNNTIDFVVTNQSGPSGLLVAMAGRARCCSCDISVGPNPLPSGTVNANYVTTLFASGGVGPYTFSAPSGGLPPGLMLSANGQLTGKPTKSGVYTFIVLVRDSRGCFVRRQIKITINGFEVSVDATIGPPPPNFSAGFKAEQQQAGTLQAKVRVNALGNENAIAFSLGFNPALLSNPQVALSDELPVDVDDAQLQVNSSQVAQGNLGISVSLPPGQALPTGAFPLVEITFTYADGSKGEIASLTFQDAPVARAATDTSGNALTPQYAARAVVLAPMVATVSAANYSDAQFAPEQIVAAFGGNLATGTQIASTSPLPTTLLGTSVKVLDSAGTERLAPLFFVSANQVNYMIPAGTAEGAAVVRITSGNGAVSGGVIEIAAIAPGIFSANASGRGFPAANLLRLKPDNTLISEELLTYNAGQNQFVAVPIDFGPATDRLFLVLYGTGLRGRSALAAVTAELGDAEAPVLFAGAQGSLFGLDQINLEIPRSLIGKGLANVTLFADGQATNTLQVVIK